MTSRRLSTRLQNSRISSTNQSPARSRELLVVGQDEVRRRRWCGTPRCRARARWCAGAAPGRRARGPARAASSRHPRRARRSRRPGGAVGRAPDLDVHPPRVAVEPSRSRAGSRPCRRPRRASRGRSASTPRSPRRCDCEASSRARAPIASSHWLARGRRVDQAPLDGRVRPNPSALDANRSARSLRTKRLSTTRVRPPVPGITPSSGTSGKDTVEDPSSTRTISSQASASS